MLVSLSVVPATGERVDRFIAEQLSISRTSAARIVAAGAVTVNGEVVRRSYKPGRGDLLEIEVPEDAPQRQLSRYNFPLTVVFEDDCFLAINKPAGLVVHPAPGHWDDTLLNALIARGTSLSTGEAGRAGIVHRLDKDTSGLILIAKTDAVHKALSEAIARRKVTREYAALIWGHVDDYQEIDAPLIRSPADRKKMMVGATGRRAVTHVTRIARFNTCDLVRVRLETGRTHQIRAHMAYIGHPVVGDPVYGGGGARRISGKWQQLARQLDRTVPRQALHAAALTLLHPENGDRIELRVDWPGDLLPALGVAAEDPEILESEKPLEYLGFFDDNE